MNDLAAAFLWSVGLLFGSAAIGVTIDALLPWNIGSSIAVLLLFAGLGFAQRWHISATVENSPGCSPVNLHVRKRGFVTKTIGHWWNPLHIGSKVSHHSLVGGRYTYDTNEIDLNLPVIAKMADTANFPPDTIEEAVVDVLEHEAIHSAIHTNAEPIYEQLEQTFRNRFREASPVEKTKLYGLSLPYHWGSNLWEEAAIEALQARRRSIRKFSWSSQSEGDT